MVIKVNVKYRNSFLSSKSSKLLKLEENYLISWIFISYTFLSMMMWISSLCTWCIIFMYMMYHLYVHDVLSLCTWCMMYHLYVHDVSSLCTWCIIFMYMMCHLYVHDVSSLCTWCIIFMYMMYHWRPQSIVLLFIHTFPKTYFSIFHKCIFTQSNVLYILSCLLPWSLRCLFKSDYFAVILKIQFILKKTLDIRMIMIVRIPYSL